MGCNISLHVEVKFEGRWQPFGCRFVQRHYKLFAMMAGVRNEPAWGITPIALPRGLPDDITPLTRAIYEQECRGVRCSNESYLDRREMCVLAEWYMRLPREEMQQPTHDLDGILGYIVGNPLYSLGEGVIEDVRLVFWFDHA